MITSPPDLRPETRERQRAELTAIVAHEAGHNPRSRVVPLLAAAAVLAVTAGLAFGIPSLRHDNAPAPATQPKQTVEPLNAADKARFGRRCMLQMNFPPGKLQRYEVVDGFRFSATDAFTTTWVVVHTVGQWMPCGFDAKGNLNSSFPQGRNQDLYRAIELRGIGAGAYATQIKRITVAVGNREPVEAVLRNGYFYTAVPYVRLRGPHTDSTRRVYVVRGYDAAGKLVYTSPRTDGEARALSNTCYISPTGKLVLYQSDNPHPDPKTCRKSYVWNYGPN
ncbi:hypothetical protein [Kribbella sp. NPDC004536]|uniref:hypothetical protein n=1 Tax=Kribbella sp. NPDC004536 TaxID=3364106 RepID=UPI00369ADBD2